MAMPPEVTLNYPINNQKLRRCATVEVQKWTTRDKARLTGAGDVPLRDPDTFNGRTSPLEVTLNQPMMSLVLKYWRITERQPEMQSYCW